MPPMPTMASLASLHPGPRPGRGAGPPPPGPLHGRGGPPRPIFQPYAHGVRGPRYPTVKAWKNAKWRQKFPRKKGPVKDHSRFGQHVHEDPATLRGTSHRLEDGQSESIAEIQEPSKAEQNRNWKNESESLAESLSVLAAKHLNIDVLDQTQEISGFVSYLLDTIQMLESQIRFNDAGNDPNFDRDTEAKKKEEEKREVFPPALVFYKVIHRIICEEGRNHDHNGQLSVDVPTPNISSSGTKGEISAQSQILNINVYCRNWPALSFYVIRDHDCQVTVNSRVSHIPSACPSERMVILSPLLLKAFEEVAEFQLYEDDTGERMNQFNAPYQFLFHHHEKLTLLAEKEPYKSVLSPLLGYLKDTFEDEYEEAREMFRQGYVNARHFFRLFKPNQMVLVRKSSEDISAFILKSYVRAEVTKDKEKIIFEGWAWTYNGIELLRAPWRKTIDPKSVSTERTLISDLGIHPVHFARAEDVEKLTNRGRKFWEMRGQVYTCYTGWDHTYSRHFTAARFMVDMATYRLMYTQSSSSFNHDEVDIKDRWPTKFKRREEVPEDVLMLMPATIHGFSFQEKKWGNCTCQLYQRFRRYLGQLNLGTAVLFVENFHPVEWNEDAFKRRLVLEEKTKEMIFALIDVQTSADRMDDIIAGKGNGLIILLHGSPGTGKTLTAESVAEIAKKPLYRVTCGDIGVEARDVEKYLESVLYLGKTWDCVLLLDEADVFLEERTMADLQRNSLVSVFLRVLEYYEGILILTSNRVGSFDEAFKSRIQVAIHYDNLTKKSRRQIWQNFFEMIEESPNEDANMVELERRLDELASQEMNGRQIRNALLTARQLAKHRKERLDWEHLSQVMKTSAAFNKYLKTVRGHSDEQWAREENLR
ncbi:hypothetical protein CMUS01_13183 [Colletotrichum musicola]|uniref:AAA+ ATPase domain-containing protein n=1 Tax=Colletotrichum musicola TaxID=2175873 RepID=A0A8H6JEX3_9PEZI|nr:hypothetical protein CMUS01_13183 [Colletotrichum musicola]